MRIARLTNHEIVRKHGDELQQERALSYDAGRGVISGCIEFTQRGRNNRAPSPGVVRAEAGATVPTGLARLIAALISGAPHLSSCGRPFYFLLSHSFAY
jgi:hypothetical protein